jgi:NTE family protein
MEQAMDAQVPSRVTQMERPLPFEVVALVLQGDGALGAYQAGVYEALLDAGIDPNWIAGMSIGAINAAIIAGIAPTDRVDRLREFWSQVTADG